MHCTLFSISEAGQCPSMCVLFVELSLLFAYVCTQLTLHAFVFESDMACFLYSNATNMQVKLVVGHVFEID